MTNETNYGLANLLLGNYQTYTQSDGIYYGDFRYMGLEGYVQDTWRPTSRVTLDYGLRVAYLGPTYSTGQFLQNYFVPDAYDPSQAVSILTANGVLRGSIVPGSGNFVNGMVEEGSSGLPKGAIEGKVNFAPRVGFAWDVTGDGNTAVRAGFGIFQERYRQNNLNFDGLGNPPLSYTPRLFGGNIDQISPALVNAGVRFPVTAVGVNGDGHPPKIYSWYVGVQRQLPWKFAIDAAYVGNRGVDFAYIRNLNQLPLGYTITNPPPNNTPDAVRPYLGYTAVNIIEFGAESEYHGLQARLTRRFGQNFTANVGYTLSKALDHVDTDNNAIGYSFDLDREWGPSGLDRRHQLTHRLRLPAAGRRDEVVQQRRSAASCSTAGRSQASAGSGAASRSPSRRTATRGRPAGACARITSAASCIPPSRRAGSGSTRSRSGVPPTARSARPPRDSCAGRASTSGTSRSTRTRGWAERMMIQFRLETFNTFNHVQFNGISTGVNVPNAGQAGDRRDAGTLGQVTSYRDPRQIQAGLKFYF